VRAALLAHTWLTERSTCDGTLVRARYYHEYPEMVVMLLREVAYGINLGLRDVHIDPFGHARYHYHIGDVDVSYSPTAVSLTVPGGGDKRITVAHLVPTAVYAVRATNRVTGQRRAWAMTTNAGGTLAVTAPIGLDWRLGATFVRRAPATPQRPTRRSVHPAGQPISIDLAPYLDNTGVTDDTDTYAATFDHCPVAAPDRRRRQRPPSGQRHRARSSHRAAACAARQRALCRGRERGRTGDRDGNDHVYRCDDAVFRTGAGQLDRVRGGGQHDRRASGLP